MIRAFELEPLLRDLTLADEYAWTALRHTGWSTLGLRTPSGRVDDAAQGPGRDTELLERAPAFRAVVDALGARNARVSALAPGGRIAERPHSAANLGAERRVHLLLIV